MGNKSEIVNNFLNTLQGKIIGAICGILVLTLVTKYEAIVETFDKGTVIERQEETKSDIMEIMSQEAFFDSLMVTKPMVKYRAKQTVILTKQMLNSKDSNRVKFSARLSQATGMTLEALVDTLAVMVNERRIHKMPLQRWKEQDLILLIKRHSYRAPTEFN
jgi:hypothetical protein